MFLAKILNGRLLPIVEVCNFEWVQIARGGQVLTIKQPRAAKAWAIRGGAAALSQTPHGAIASAKVVIEQALLESKGKELQRPKAAEGVR